MIVFEYPCYERIRTLLRLESVYNRAKFLSLRESIHDFHGALLSIFEILDITMRTELKNELLQELALQIQFTNHPSEYEYEKSFKEQLKEAHSSLQKTQIRFGQELRDNDWLMMVKSRSSIPGGACPFDLPSLHMWLQQDANLVRADLLSWLKIFEHQIRSVFLILEILRNKIDFTSANTTRKVFLVTQFSQNIALLRIRLAKDLMLLPEVSASKNAVHIRFVNALPRVARPKQSEAEVNFEIAMSSLN